MSRTDFDVLVVGAGPTGLTLGAQLLARGVRTGVIEKDTDVARLSRAIGVQPRTMEMLETMGIVDRFLDEGHPVRRVSVYAGAKRRMTIDMAYCDSSYKFMLHLPQQRTEALLREHLAELGGVLERGVALDRFSDDGDVVTAVVRHRDGRTAEVTTSYLVGCDGAHSTVRHLLDVPFVGQPYPWDWLLADLRVDWPGRPDEVHVFSRPDGLPLACVPITDQLWRLSLPLPGDREGRPPTLAEVQDLVEQRGPGGMKLSEPETLTTFRCQLRSTPTTRRGRILLAGDAAHIHSPAGGQGMNTGMADATNLSWKLALVVAGRATDRLLGTYEAERVPVARQVMGFTQQTVRFATTPRSFTRVARDAVLPAYRLPVVQRRLVGRMSQTAVAYRTSPLTRPGADWAGTPAGSRVPNVSVVTPDGPSTLFSILASGRHVLLMAGQSPPPNLRALGLTDSDDTVVPARAGSVASARGRFALVRPDGHLAAVATADDPSPVRCYLRDLARGAAFLGSSHGGGQK